MNNKPVAWMVDEVLFNSLGTALNISFDIEQPCIPLYTHPVKELTDSEIRLLADEYLFINRNCNEIEGYNQFAKAILRKAQDNG